MILHKNRTNDDKVLFIDASQEFKKENKQNVLTEENLKKIFNTVKSRKDVDKFAHLATKEEIIKNDYNLNIPRYVDTSEQEEDIDIDEVRKEIAQCTRDEKDAIAEINEMMAELGLGGI
jgi:type I restriction enzyme M protein